MAYEDIFDSTRLAKDTVAVAEFNKIAAAHRPSLQNPMDFRDQQFRDNGKSVKTDLPLLIKYY